MSRLRILLAEDHEIVRHGIKLLVDSQTDLEVIGEAGNGEIAVKMANELKPDIIVMDVSMPLLNGLKATRKIREKSAQMKILILTRHTDDGYLQQLLCAGANGYVLKQSAPEDLIRAIRVVASGEGYVDMTLTKKIMDGYVAKSASPPPLRGESNADITERESRVLQMIAWGYGNKEIAARMEISVKTVEAHKANAMRKMNMQSRIDVVRYAILRGWLEEN